MKITDEEIEKAAEQHSGVWDDKICAHQSFVTGAKWHRLVDQNMRDMDQPDLAHDEKLQDGQEKPTWKEWVNNQIEEVSKQQQAGYDSMKMVKEITDMNHKLGTAIIDNSHLRETALKMSRDLNPNVVISHGLGQYGAVSTPPSIDKILTDAEKIYEWLIKG